VPGDPARVAALGYDLRTTAHQIVEETSYLRSLCTDDYWDSEAGTAFRAKLQATASKLHRAHARYAAAADALGHAVNGSGYAAALNEAQAMSARALTQASEAWTVMRRQLAIVTAGPAGAAAYEDGSRAYPGELPRLDAKGTPVYLAGTPRDTPDVKTAKNQYNGWADDLARADRWCRQAVQLRDEAASSAASRILAVVEGDGLQDPAGLAALFGDIGHALDDAGRYIDANWAAWVADIANLCSWLATVLGFLAMIFAFIPGLQELAIALEGLAITLTEIAALCHLVLLATGHKEAGKELILDMVALASFGIGGSILRGAEGTTKAAEELSHVGFNAVADSLEQALSRYGAEGLSAISRVTDKAASVGENAVGQAWQHGEAEMPSFLRGLASKGTWEQALHPIDNIRAVRMEWHLADFNASFKAGTLPTLRQALGKALTFSSPEIAQQAEKIGKVPEIGMITQVTGFQFAGTVARYGHLYTPVQMVAVGTDTWDKITTATDWVGQEIMELNSHG
jgi:hypothetical protein